MKIGVINFDKDPFIIAIGASAGGMEAIHLLFDHTPEDGVAYVIIQHLSPDYKSFMSELLAKHSRLKIVVAENDMFVEPNHVYLMPQGKNMTIKNLKLFLTDLKPYQPNKSIDIFFDSLAESHKEKSIAVILSGTGTDGTKGIAAIKRNGGFVIVQDPQSAKFEGMPKSAIDSGNVDVILTPDLIPEEIIAYLKQNLLERDFSDHVNEDHESDLVKILGLIQDHTPLDFSDYKRPTIVRRIILRMAKNKIASLREYVAFLEDNPSEISSLAKEFLISVTKFFRDKEAFEVIKEKVIPEIVENKLQVDTIKVWVVGCATGEEAYSLAILISDYLTDRKKNLEVKIFASDIDKTALHQASKGVYSSRIENDVSKERLDKYFIKHGDHYKVRDNIRKMLIFADHDIVKQPPYGKIDLISCRNLLIYINPILQKKILTSLHFCLNLGGYLFLGPSESLGESKKSFIEVNKKWRIFKSIEVVRNFRDTTYSTPGLDRQLESISQVTVAQRNTEKGNLLELFNQSLLEISGFEAAIWINGDLKIIQSLGNYEKYLLPKLFNFNLLEMLPDEVSIATSTSIRLASKNNQESGVKKVSFNRNDKSQSVNVFVKPFLSDTGTAPGYFLVLFSDDKSKHVFNPEAIVFEKEEQVIRHLENLKEELAETKQKLTQANSALEESNDNISSYNEELISSNEEMQSVNEELQSVNEELQTVNNEYQLKIKELAELNDELNNYFKSTINAQLYVDQNLVLRKFTPSAIRQINLKESDVGRMISDITTNIRFSTVITDIQKVITSSENIEKEVQTLDGRWYQMMGVPYVRQQDNQNEGVIITFNDITELKKVQDKLSRINDEHKTFIYSVSHDLRGPLSNLKTCISLLKIELEPKFTDLFELVSMTDNSINNLTEIIRELTDVVKIETEIEVPEIVNLKELLPEVEVILKDRFVNLKYKINYDIKEPEIQFSKKNLRSILFNILSNAMKYRSPDRELELTIRTEKLNGELRLSIQDNGLGIAESQRSKIFGAFHRAHDHVEGIGVGLYLVKKIINNAGGDIEVDSEVGKGSNFMVYFPKRQKV